MQVPDNTKLLYIIGMAEMMGKSDKGELRCPICNSTVSTRKYGSEGWDWTKAIFHPDWCPFSLLTRDEIKAIQTILRENRYSLEKGIV